VEYGMLQGSVLGQILFMLYINDLTEAVKGQSWSYCADDMNLLITRKGEFDIQNKIINV
jgi:hypothetical protein